MDLDTGSSGDALEELSLREASRLHAVELTTLQSLVRRGRIDAYKVRGPWGREWRVTRMTLEGLGYPPRPDHEPDDGGDDDRVARLERELAAARRAAAAERSRAEQADRRLGEALMESGRLRAALAVAEGGAGQDAPPVVDLSELREALLDLPVGRRPGNGS